MIQVSRNQIMLHVHAYKQDSRSVIQGNKSTMHRRAQQNKIQSVIQANKIQPVIQANKIQQNKDAPTAHGCSNRTRMLLRSPDNKNKIQKINIRTRNIYIKQKLMQQVTLTQKLHDNRNLSNKINYITETP